AMIRLTLTSTAVLAVLAFAGVASAHSGQTVVKISAASGMAMKFSTTKLGAKAGVVTIVMKNAGMMPHNVAIKGKGVNGKGRRVPHGGTSTVTASLHPGRYVFYCSVAGHEGAGMKGTLTVS